MPYFYFFSSSNLVESKGDGAMDEVEDSEDDWTFNDYRQSEINKEESVTNTDVADTSSVVEVWFSFCRLALHCLIYLFSFPCPVGTWGQDWWNLHPDQLPGQWSWQSAGKADCWWSATRNPHYIVWARTRWSSSQRWSCWAWCCSTNSDWRNCFSSWRSPSTHPTGLNEYNWFFWSDIDLTWLSSIRLKKLNLP